MTKPTKWHVRQAKTQLSFASAHSDQSLRCPHEETLGPQLPIERTAKTLIKLADTQADLSLRWAHRSFCWFVMRRLRLHLNAWFLHLPP